MVDLLLDAQALLGESPRWHAPEARLYWVDIDAHRIHRTDPATGATESMQLDQPVGCVAPRAGGGLVMGLKDGCALIDAWGEDPRAFGPAVLAGIAEQRFNDGCVDAAGRFWVGSVTRDKSNPGAMLFRLDPDGALTPMLGGLLTSNGAAFSPDGRTFIMPTRRRMRYTPMRSTPRPARSATAGCSTSSSRARGVPTAERQMPRAVTGRRCGTAGASCACRPPARFSRRSRCPSSAPR